MTGIATKPAAVDTAVVLHHTGVRHIQYIIACAKVIALHIYSNLYHKNESRYGRIMLKNTIRFCVVVSIRVSCLSIITQQLKIEGSTYSAAAACT